MKKAKYAGNIKGHNTILKIIEGKVEGKSKKTIWGKITYENGQGTAWLSDLSRRGSEEI